MDIIVIPDGAPICCCGDSLPPAGDCCCGAGDWTSVTAGGLTLANMGDNYPTEMPNGDSFSLGTPPAIGGVWYGANQAGTYHYWVWAYRDDGSKCPNSDSKIAYAAFYADYRPKNDGSDGPYIQFNDQCCEESWNGTYFELYDVTDEYHVIIEGDFDCECPGTGCDPMITSITSITLNGRTYTKYTEATVPNFSSGEAYTDSMPETVNDEVWWCDDDGIEEWISIAYSAECYDDNPNFFGYGYNVAAEEHLNAVSACCADAWDDASGKYRLVTDVGTLEIT